MHSISTFLRKTMGVEWNFDKYFTTQDSDNDSSNKTKKLKINHIEENTCDKLILTENNDEINLTGLSPMVILTPIEHIFSHQKHFMNIYYSRVKFVDDNNDDHINDNNNNSKYDKKNKNNVKKNENEILNENINDLSWTSVCGQNREIKWMNAHEITEAGITTGCKKILTEVLKQT
jgi:hypothetical protein